MPRELFSYLAILFTQLLQRHNYLLTWRMNVPKFQMIFSLEFEIWFVKVTAVKNSLGNARCELRSSR